MDQDVPLPNSVSYSGQKSRLALISYILTNQNRHDLLHVYTGILLPSRMLGIIDAFWHKPIILRINSYNMIRNYSQCPPLPRRLLLSKINKFIALSPEIEEGLLQMGITRDRIALIPNGIDIQMFSPPENSAHKESLRQKLFPNIQMSNRIAFLYTGRIEEKNKKCLTMLDLWSASDLPNQGHMMVMAGPINEADTNARNRLEDYKEKGMNIGTFWTGALETNQLIEYYRASDFHILPSLQEGFSNALIEAAACGLPLVVRNSVSGNSQIVTSATGFQFDKDENIIPLLTYLTHIDARSYGINARLRAEKFDNRNIVNQYHQLYQSLERIPRHN